MLDRVELKVRAGKGGKGAVTFRREKFVPFGGPFGGDGGKGGNVIVKADASIGTLRSYKHRREFKAENGQPGMTKKKHGADAGNLVLGVPPGTLVFQKNEAGGQDLLADLEKGGQEVVVARGGRGGYGNTHFATPTSQAPRIAQPGMPGEEMEIVLELRLIADVGIIGYPNVGKSSLLSALSAASPKVADYPFTTLEPVLGVVKADGNSFVLAEIPGLVEGAHAGKGLGIDFLRHAMRTRVLIHLLDGRSESPLDDLIKVNNELSMFDTSLAGRAQVIAINKIDLPEVRSRIGLLKSTFAEAGIYPLFISAAAGDGLKELVAEIWKLLVASDVKTKTGLQPAPRVFRPRPVDMALKVQKKGGGYIISEPELERILGSYDLDDPAEWPEFYDQLDKLGINSLLEAAGARSGDTIITGKKEWKWYSDEDRRIGRNV
jgi:GTP-binding protein